MDSVQDTKIKISEASVVVKRLHVKKLIIERKRKKKEKSVVVSP